MKCPRCKAVLAGKSYEGVEIDFCSACGGTWLDSGEIQTIVEARGKKFSEAQVTQVLQAAKAGIPEVEKKSVEICPKCSGEMTPMNYNYSSGIIIDVCPKGHGIWFDKGELEKVQVFFEQWDERARKERGSWAELARREEKAADAEDLAEHNRLRENLGPVGNALDTLLNWMKSGRSVR